VEIAAVAAAAEGPALTALVRWDGRGGGPGRFVWEPAAGTWRDGAARDASSGR
jgi:hypothetical protein